MVQCGKSSGYFTRSAHHRRAECAGRRWWRAERWPYLTDSDAETGFTGRMDWNMAMAQALIALGLCWDGGWVGV